MRVLFLFGPNLGALGSREPERYGTRTLAEIMRDVEEHAAKLGLEISHRQSEAEAELVGWIETAANDGFGAIVINAGALTHYSTALREAIAAAGIPAIEVHMTNVDAREEFRRRSELAPVCRVTIAGAGEGSYHLALEALPWITD